ncbi:MAG: hypothetical protein F4Y69_12400 [Chloroflexi bacterium]|nr:hypothetical protein [Chloroflexota bacterium]MYF21234.1 hypothetical protein [Chloroflexota bacterium]
MTSIHDAIADLHRIAYVEGKRQSPARLNALADFCVQELESRGLSGVGTEARIPGFGREKSWDVAWEYDGKVRLAISLKSILSNIPGTVPNRIDDLMGEVANVQLLSPEIVLGYVMVFNRGEDTADGRWINRLKRSLDGLSGRGAPAWGPGTFEAHVLVEATFGDAPTVHAGTDDFGAFFDTLVARVAERNPGHEG